MTKIDKLITGFLNNDLDESQKKELKEWLDSSPSNREYFKKLESLNNAAEIVGNPKGYAPAFENSQVRIQMLVNSRFQKFKVRLLWGNVAAIAAVIVFGLIITSVFFRDENVLPEAACLVYQEIYTPKGGQSQLVLNDGTKVWLNADSKLTFPGRFEGDIREVSLIGEAYFEVHKNKERPFYVRAGEIDIKVTGTTFNLKNYPEENSIETTLIEGEVILEKPGDENTGSVEIATLKPNEKITLFKDNEGIDENQKIITESLNPDENVVPVKTIKNAVLTENVNIEKAVCWKNNQVIFENDSFEEIVNQLERRFGVEIIFKTEHARHMQFTGTFNEISIEGVMEAMSFASPFEYRIKKDTIMISDY